MLMLKNNNRPTTTTAARRRRPGRIDILWRGRWFQRGWLLILLAAA
jgi:hypothetical protein